MDLLPDLADATFFEHFLLCARLVLGSLTAISILHRKQDPMACLGWLLFVALLPIVSSFVYLIGGFNPYENYARRKRKSYEAAHGRKLPVDRRALNAVNQRLIDAGGFEGLSSTTEWIANLRGEPFYADTGVDFLLNSKVNYEAFATEIIAAKKFLLVQFYQILPDSIGCHFLELLAQKAEQGVQVFVLFDAMGSYRLNAAILAPYRKRGLQIRNFLAMHPVKRRFQINWRNHRKLLVRDGEVAFVGGLNLGETYLEGPDPLRPVWQDANFRLTGSIVNGLVGVFEEDWHFASGKLLGLASPGSPLTPPSKPKGLVNFVTSGPADSNTGFHTALVTLILESRERVWIATPYFVPDKALMQALRQAVARGVDVRVLIPKRSNHPMTDFCSTSYFAEFQEIGLRLYLFLPGVSHAKMILVDADGILSGSSNMDYRSFFLNFELDLFIRSLDLARKVESFFLAAFQLSEQLTLLKHKSSSIPVAFFRRVMRLLAPVM